MKHIKIILFIVAMFLVASTSHAQLDEAIISASLSTQAVSGTTYSLHTVPVNNKSIINAIVSSGSFPGLKAKDCAIVYTNSSNEAVEVINTSNKNAVVMVLAVNGTESSFNAVESGAITRQLDLATDTDYEFTLPNAATTFVTNAVIKFHYNQVTGALENFSFSFVGASGLYSSGATFFQGTIKKGTKVYQ